MSIKLYNLQGRFWSTITTNSSLVLKITLLTYFEELILIFFIKREKNSYVLIFPFSRKKIIVALRLWVFYFLFVLLVHLQNELQNYLLSPNLLRSTPSFNHWWYVISFFAFAQTYNLKLSRGKRIETAQVKPRNN